MSDPRLEAERQRWILVLRWVAFLLAALGVVWDAVAGWAYLFPGPSGEWARLAIPVAAIGGIPAGLFAILFWYIGRRPPSKWGRIILLTALLAMGLPFLLALWDRWH
ncbi:MAG TPA: hypothetical protein VFI13_01885 [Gemmatimonadales bacterium]|nr:hypothetical protein [Gemmatimonadales bacterium]